MACAEDTLSGHRPQPCPRHAKKQVGKASYVLIRRVRLLPGKKYTLQTEYDGTHRQAHIKLCISGINPLSYSDRATPPKGTTGQIPCIGRSFPGGKILGMRFGLHQNFTVSDQSTLSDAFVILFGDTPAVGLRLRFLQPALPDQQIRKSGRYRISAKGETRHSGGQVHKHPLWLGFARGEPPLPYPWDIKADPGVQVDGDWDSRWGD